MKERWMTDDYLQTWKGSISHLLGRVLRLVRPLGASSRSFSDVIGWPKMKERLHDANDRLSDKELAQWTVRWSKMKEN